MTFSPSNTLSPFLPVNQTFSEDHKQFLIQITNRDRDIARYINIRGISIFDLTETPSAEQWFTTSNPPNPNDAQIKRNGFRKIIPFSPLVAGLNSFPHGIAGIGANFTFTHIYGTARNAAGTIQVPLPQGGANTSMVEIDPTNINVTIPAAYAGFSCIIVLEYLKN